MKKIIIGIFCGLISAFMLNADQKADEIMRKNYGLQKADDSYAVATMVLIDKRGNRKTRKVVMYTQQTEKGENTFIEFLEPADVKGTRFLTIGNEEGDDDQRLYLPALKKVRKISSSSKSGKFMGSDLYYYDMEDRGFNDGAYRYIKDEVFNGRDSWVIEVIPKDKDAPYSKTQVWVSKDNYFANKIDAYDKKGKLLKTILFLEVQEINGVLTPIKTVVDNYQDEHKTLLSVEQTVVNGGVDSSIFSIQNLEK